MQGRKRYKTVRREGRVRGRPSNLVAAYDLGLNVVTLRYNARYLRRFPWDPRAGGGRGIRACLRWIADDLAILMPDLPRDTPPRALLRMLTEFGTGLSAHGLADLPTAFQPDRISTLTRCWRQVTQLSAAALRERPFLVRWYQLGHSVGSCYLKLLSEDRSKVLASLPRVLEAAKRLPVIRAEQVKVIRLLRAQSAAEASSDPLNVLRNVLFRDPRKREEFDAADPRTSVIHQVARLDRKIKRSLERAPDSPVLEVSLERLTAKLNEKSYQITRAQGIFLQAVYDAQGLVVSSSTLKRRFPRLESVNLSDARRELHDDLKSLIGSPKGYSGGYHWLG